MGVTTGIKAIETRYQGYRFRSRLETRWAVFFDALGIKWEYEPEGFVLSTGEKYLPDFWLPEFAGGVWAEVKPDSDSDWRKAEQLCEDSRMCVWLCGGVPGFSLFRIIRWTPPLSDEPGSGFIYGIPMIPFSTYYAEAVGEDEWTESAFRRTVDRSLVMAVDAARGARFEHGETPTASPPNNRQPGHFDDWGVAFDNDDINQIVSMYNTDKHRVLFSHFILKEELAADPKRDWTIERCDGYCGCALTHAPWAMDWVEGLGQVFFCDSDCTAEWFSRNG